MNVTLDFEGRAIAAEEGEPLAVALYRAGERVLGRSAKYHRPRGAPCLTGHCGSCLVRADGIPNRPACQTPCHDGLRVQRQNALPNATHDLLRAADFVFSKGMNHHELLVGVPGVQPLMTAFARQLAGLGELPDEPGAPFEPAEERACGTLLIGLGRSGREALRGLTKRDLAIEARPFQGDDSVWALAQALGIYSEGGAAVVAVRRGRQLVRVKSERIVLCVGSRAQISPFPGCDLPGVMTDEAARILARHGVKPGGRSLVVGEPSRVDATAAALRAVGVDVTIATNVTQALGTHSVTGAELEGGGTWKGEAIAIAGPRAPAFELGEQAGAVTVHVAGHGFGIVTDSRGQTRIPWLAAYGSCAAVRT